MKYIFPLLFILSYQLAAQQTTITGKVVDGANAEPLIGVTILITSATGGIVTDEFGQFSVQVAFPCVLRISYTGFETKFITVNQTQNEPLIIMLTESSNKLNEVVVKASAQVDVSQKLTGVTSLSMQQISSVPVLGGEKDILKVIQLMPGIQQSSQGNTAMLVRGGGADQNLIMIDDAPVYNPGHALGFFSVFNPDALKDVTLQKGGFTANYGGRLSSITDIRTKDGNMKKWETHAGVGMLAIRASVEGPLVKDKLSLTASFRRSHVDQLFRVVGNHMPVYFYDANAKLTWLPNHSDRFSLTIYQGEDVMRFTNDMKELRQYESLQFRTDMGNQTISAKWNHAYANKKLFHNITFVKTQFRFDVLNQLDTNYFLIQSSLNDYIGKAQFTYQLNNSNQIRTGAELTHHMFRPNRSRVHGIFNENIVAGDGLYIPWLEGAAYVSHDATLSQRIHMQYGLRLSSAHVQQQTYIHAEPRVQVSYEPILHHIFKAAYSEMTQYAHLVSGNSSSMPTDMWYPVTNAIKPQQAIQYTIGYSHMLSSWQTEFTVEAYWKDMKNLVEFKDGAISMLNNNIESDLLQGNGNSMGIELLLHKKTGKWNGWLAYTLSKSVRQFDGLNEGETFYTRYNRTHNISAVVNYEWSQRITFSAVFAAASGSRFTPIIGKYLMPNPGYSDVEVMPIYGKRNAHVLSATHRLDLNVVIKSKPGKRFQSEWHIGAYNVYNQAQPYRLELTQNDNNDLVYRELGLFGFLPAIAYNIKF